MRAEGALSRSNDAPTPQTWLEQQATAAGAWIAEAAEARDIERLGAFLQLQGSLIVQAALRLRALALEPRPLATRPAEGRWIGIREVARLTNRSVSWIRHAARDAIPGRRPNGPGCRAEWWEPTVRQWLSTTGGAC